MIKYNFEGIGTHWEIDINQEISKHQEEEILSKIKDRIEIFDKNYSRFREDSLVTEMSRKEGVYLLPPDADLIMNLYKAVYDVTNGLVTPLIGKTLVQAGYDQNYTLIKGEMTSPKPWNELLDWSSPNLTVKEPALLDFGAAGKGYLVDIVSNILEEEGVTNYCVDASGDMRYRKKNFESLKVGLEDPNDENRVVGVVNLMNKSLCGSSGSRRKWADMHHIINPETLSSPREIIAIWTIAETTMLADILTTCLFFVSPEKLNQFFKFEYLILNEEYWITKSSGFDAEIFIG
ncbi:MAG TPA: FAD:protein FMN transferase [Candidatus Paceibacterota bacterium]